MPLQLQPEHQEIADEKVKEWVEQYVTKNGVQPSTRAITYVRNQIQRSLLPTSAIIKKLMEIGHKGLAARKPDHQEFDSLASELDRRLPVGQVDMDLINQEVAKLNG